MSNISLIHYFCIWPEPSSRLGGHYSNSICLLPNSLSTKSILLALCLHRSLAQVTHGWEPVLYLLKWCHEFQLIISSCRYPLIPGRMVYWPFMFLDHVGRNRIKSPSLRICEMKSIANSVKNKFRTNYLLYLGLHVG